MKIFNLLCAFLLLSYICNGSLIDSSQTKPGRKSRRRGSNIHTIFDTPKDQKNKANDSKDKKDSNIKTIKDLIPEEEEKNKNPINIEDNNNINTLDDAKIDIDRFNKILDQKIYDEYNKLGKPYKVMLGSGEETEIKDHRKKLDSVEFMVLGNLKNKDKIQFSKNQLTYINDYGKIVVDNNRDILKVLHTSGIIKEKIMSVTLNHLNLSNPDINKMLKLIYGFPKLEEFIFYEDNETKSLELPKLLEHLSAIVRKRSVIKVVVRKELYEEYKDIATQIRYQLSGVDHDNDQHVVLERTPKVLTASGLEVDKKEEDFDELGELPVLKRRDANPVYDYKSFDPNKQKRKVTHRKQ